MCWRNLRRICWLLASLGFLGPGVRGHEDGAPESVCKTMFPGHGIDPQDSDSPYSLGVAKALGEYGGDSVVVTIFSPEPPGFQGFFLQARDANDKNLILDGTFSTPSNTRRQSCPPFQDNTLTHGNKDPKGNLTTVWTPPGGFQGQVVFRATVAEKWDVFWMDLETVPLSVTASAREVPAPALPTSPSPPTESTEENLVNYDDYDVCGVKKGCFGLPSSCIEKKKCEILLMYMPQTDGVTFELTGAISNGTEIWMAVGLSGDNAMGDDSVTECFNAPAGGVMVQQSWNVPPPRQYNRVLDNRHQGISNIRGSVSDGALYCTWKRQLATNVEGITFNLTHDKYYLLLAKGQIREDGSKRKHTRHLSSNGNVNLTVIGVVAGKPDYLVKIHGAFMITAWIGFVSVGILVARHYKNVWENDTLCTLNVWFACHRTLMVTSVGLIISAFVCIFIYVNGWSSAPNLHPILGCIATGLAVIQPIMALFRPKPNATNRYVFNWLHWLVGNSAQIIAVVTMFYAVDLSAVNLGIGFYYVLIGFVAVHFIFHVIMQIHTYAMEKKGQFQVHNAMQLHEMNKETKELSKDSPGSGFRRFMLGIYIVINAGIVTTLVLLVILQ